MSPCNQDYDIELVQYFKSITQGFFKKMNDFISYGSRQVIMSDKALSENKIYHKYSFVIEITNVAYCKKRFYLFYQAINNVSTLLLNIRQVLSCAPYSPVSCKTSCIICISYKSQTDIDTQVNLGMRTPSVLQFLQLFKTNLALNLACKTQVNSNRKRP